MKKNSITTQSHFHRVVITGGPCAGKTTALSYLYDKLSSLGFTVLIVPEVARLMFSGGVSLENASDDEVFAVQQSFVVLQKGLESAFQCAASQTKSPNGKPIIVLCDRGGMDMQAFVAPEVWQTILDENDYSEVELRDWPYDSVIHMVTAANGAEAFYVNDNIRKETAEQSRDVDRKLQEAWTGHAHLAIIENGPDGFEGKLKRTLAAVLRSVGYPVPVEIERKYLVNSVDKAQLSKAKAQRISIEQYYLVGGDRVRKRGQNGKYTYTRTTKKELPTTPDGPLQRVETECQIPSRDYHDAIKNFVDANTSIIRKDRYCFLYEGQYFELDVFLGPASEGLIVLEIELASADQKVVLPHWIEVTEEVTGNKAYSNYELSCVKP